MDTAFEVEPSSSVTVAPAGDGIIRRSLGWVHFDTAPTHRVPAPLLLIAATVTSLVACLLADWLIAHIATRVFPSIAGYPHFQFGDYSRLTVLGVLAACAGWPIVVRLCATPRWLFLRLAVLVTAVLLIPDAAIWVHGDPGRAVAGLVLMHLAIGLITYNALVRLAPARERS